eukprot:364884-Chlamydomonas_euryale.AAC.2
MAVCCVSGTASISCTRHQCRHLHALWRCRARSCNLRYSCTFARDLAQEGFRGLPIAGQGHGGMTLPADGPLPDHPVILPWCGAAAAPTTPLGRGAGKLPCSLAALSPKLSQRSWALPPAPQLQGVGELFTQVSIWASVGVTENGHGVRVKSNRERDPLWGNMTWGTPVRDPH